MSSDGMVAEAHASTVDAARSSGCTDLGEEKAVEIAKDYLEENLGANLADRSSYETCVMCHEGKWLVTVTRLPRVPGGFNIVVVRMSGEVEQVCQGR